MKQRTGFLQVITWIVVAFSIFPLVILIPVSFNAQPLLAWPSDGVSTIWYSKMLFDTNFPAAAGASIVVAILSTALALAIGTLAAWALARNQSRWATAIEAFLLSPLLLARVVYGVAMLILLSQIGLIRTTTGLMIAHVVIVTPYVVRIVGGTLVGVARSLEESAAVLGATPKESFRHITLPLIRPGIVASAVFSFIISFDEFTMSVFLVGPNFRTLPVEMFRYVSFAVDPAVAAISVCLIGLSALAVVAVERTLGLDKLLGAR